MTAERRCPAAGGATPDVCRIPLNGEPSRIQRQSMCPCQPWPRQQWVHGDQLGRHRLNQFRGREFQGMSKSGSAKEGVDPVIVLAISTAPRSAWPAEGGQNFFTIANHHAASAGIRKIDRDVSTDACRGRKNDTLDALRNPDPSQLLGRRIPAATKTEPDNTCQF